MNALSSGELKQKRKKPLLVMETIYSLDKGQSLALSSTHSREGRLPTNLPMTTLVKGSLLEDVMDWGIVRDGLPFFQEEVG